MSLLTLILVPLTVLSILVSRALPLTLVTITPGIVGGLISLLVLMVPRTRTAESLSATVTSGVLGWLLGVLLYSLIFSQITSVVQLIVITAIQPAIFIIAITALIQATSRRRREGESTPPMPIQQVLAATVEPKTGPVTVTAEISTATERAIGTQVGGAEPTPKGGSPKAEPSQEGKRRVADFIEAGQPIIVLSAQERTIVELLAELEGALVPAKDIAAETGGRYITVEKALLYDPVTIFNAISSLLRKGVLENAGFVFKSVCCPKCLKADAFTDLVCPYCRSDNISRQDIYQCSNCGYLGPQQSYVRGPFYECPQCRIRAEAVTAYQTTMSGQQSAAQPVFLIYSSMFKCDSCNSIFDVPRTTYFCKSCGEIYDIQTGQIFRYMAVKLKPAYREAVLKEKRPIILLSNLLRGLGLIIEAPYIMIDEMGVSRMADLVVKAYGRVVAAVFVMGVPYKSTADVVSEAFWFKVHEGATHVYVLSLSRPTPEVVELVKNLDIELVDLYDVRDEELPERLSAIVNTLRKFAG